MSADCTAGVLFTSYALREEALALTEQLPNCPHLFMADGIVEGYQAYEAARDACPTQRVADESAGIDMLYSSGTTGRPKGVKKPLPEDPIDAVHPVLDLLVDLYGFDPETVYLSPAPLYHAAPLLFTMTIMRMGGTVVVMEHFDAEQSLQLIERYRVTHSQWVPTIFVRMLKLPLAVRSQFDLGSLEVAIHAAAPCPIAIKRQMMDWWGPIIYEYYGGSEGNGMSTIGPHQWLAHEGSVGQALFGVLHICDDAGNELPVGETGIVYFADGPEFEYYNDVQKTQQSHLKNGWSTLGDVGYLDAEGFLYLTDRKAFMIISGGVNIYPRKSRIY